MILGRSFILESLKDVPEEFHRDWIRGFFDRGGIITNLKNKCLISIWSTKEVLEWIQNKAGIKGIIEFESENSTFILKISAESEIKRFAHYIYDGATEMLEEKYNKFKELGVI